MSLENDVQRADLARQVIENTVYAEAHTLIELEITRKWRESKDKDEREDLHRALRALVMVKTVLESTMKSGKVAANKLTQDRSRVQRIGDYLSRAS
jgi:hypothetical protein